MQPVESLHRLSLLSYKSVLCESPVPTMHFLRDPVSRPDILQWSLVGLYSSKHFQFDFLNKPSLTYVAAETVDQFLLEFHSILEYNSSFHLSSLTPVTPPLLTSILIILCKKDVNTYLFSGCSSSVMLSVSLVSARVAAWERRECRQLMGLRSQWVTSPLCALLVIVRVLSPTAAGWHRGDYVTRVACK